MTAGADHDLEQPRTHRTVRLFLCGDVMTGRGIDQVLPQPCDPQLFEPYARSALHYVQLAEDTNGAIPKPGDFSYVWGDALEELDRARPDACIVNLETSITRREAYEPKGINYRMSPENAGCLTAAHIDCCVLANNHVLDWGPAGLLDTLTTLERLPIKTAGAGRNRSQASAPAILDLGAGRRVIVFAFASTSSGTPSSWAAGDNNPGVNMLLDFSDDSIAWICDRVASISRRGDVVIVSIHWGPNWGYDISPEHRRFAHALIDRSRISVVHGHSSHHPKAIEVYRNRLILYGCGDFLNDYEGIEGYEAFRDDLVLMYLADLDAATGRLVALEMVPLQIRKFRLVHPSRQDVERMERMLNREGKPFGTHVAAAPGGRFSLAWPHAVSPTSRFWR